MPTKDAELYRLRLENATLRRDLASLREAQTTIAGLRDETERAFMISVTLLAKAAELHDEETGNHILRVDRYAADLSTRMALPAAFCREIGYSAALHDVGKMSIDSALLRKRGSLTPAERREMELHTEYGWQILRQSDRLRMAADIARCHHERWDGQGYPRGLAGEDIPLAARIVALCDVYDALRSPRPYKEGMAHEDVRERLAAADGHFDPAVRSCFLAHHESFAAIYTDLVDRKPARADGARPDLP
ncbi:HD-GYP domain-containing protein (c-di-GMP phosphodiesterase class II) [Constrictibacter sp. MBR-5]|jgi:HD-GYP domain-containing protein (c-di-GMP phosphodiesterase class II)|uniref:HD-GYP domain-containing protein n=1 Tax=Constrictibacter sp. MBR-5 TaxID=3156467 RepID=UPI003393FB95